MKSSLPMIRFLIAIAICVTSHSFSKASIRTDAGFNANTLARNDDGSTGLVNLGFTVNFYGIDRSSGFVNNNGNFTFDAALSTFTPFDLSTTNREILAPFFADVDTRAGGQPVKYGTSTVDGNSAFGVNWIDVDYYFGESTRTNLNSFQLVIVDRSDVAPGDFDFEFNYDQILWETGEASGGNDSGLGGASARVGWSNGIGDTFELAGSAINGAFLDGGSNALVSNRLNSPIDGRYVFNVRSGIIVVPPNDGVPEAVSFITWALLCCSATWYRRRHDS